ncbi:MAG: hypothetical protein AVDCRST_MAG51-2734 [uncultured Ramlibacter sp.]|uniref:Uncharacterized protein n=1 Tax=uncultured Ramlibacter sp. TaxID=260755 RepID=A0A6J4Q3U6_9BURK|nr:MAG: hypothetical protein AVDCRST_MAG51-2734 [uncultured Ramlibacter sp.]
MRWRMILLVLAILAVAGFAAQNWPEFNRRTTLNFGILQSEAPLGLILLTLLGLVLLIFVASVASMRTRSLMESRQHAKALHAQRELADKAEASRFTDLRQVLDSHLRESRQHETLANKEMEKTMAQHQRELRNQLEQMYHLLTSRITELERRIDPRAVRSEPPLVGRVDNVTPGRPVDPLGVQGPQGRERV